MSTKRTLLHGENFHLYRDGFDYLPYLEFNGKKIKMPDDFAKALLTLVLLHDCTKHLIEYTKQLDKIDGGIFGISLDTGEKSEFKSDGKFHKEGKGD